MADGTWTEVPAVLVHDKTGAEVYTKEVVNVLDQHKMKYLGRMDVDDTSQTALNKRGEELAGQLYGCSDLRTGYVLRDMQGRDWRYDTKGDPIPDINIVGGQTVIVGNNIAGCNFIVSFSVETTASNGSYTAVIGGNLPNGTQVGDSNDGKIIINSGKGTLKITFPDTLVWGITPFTNNGSAIFTLSFKELNFSPVQFTVSVKRGEITATIYPSSQDVTEGKITDEKISVNAQTTACTSTLSYLWYKVDDSAYLENQNGPALSLLAIKDKLVEGVNEFYAVVSGNRGEPEYSTDQVTVTVKKSQLDISETDNEWLNGGHIAGCPGVETLQVTTSLTGSSYSVTTNPDLVSKGIEFGDLKISSGQGTIQVKVGNNSLPGKYSFTISAGGIESSPISLILKKETLSVLGSPTNETVVQGNNLTLTATVTVECNTDGVDPVAYLWYTVDDSNGSNLSPISNATYNQYVVPTSAPGTSYYQAKAYRNNAEAWSPVFTVNVIPALVYIPETDSFLVESNYIKTVSLGDITGEISTPSNYTPSISYFRAFPQEGIIGQGILDNHDHFFLEWSVSNATDIRLSVEAVNDSTDGSLAARLMWWFGGASDNSNGTNPLLTYIGSDLSASPISNQSVKINVPHTFSNYYGGYNGVATRSRGLIDEQKTVQLIYTLTATGPGGSKVQKETVMIYTTYIGDIVGPVQCPNRFNWPDASNLDRTKCGFKLLDAFYTELANRGFNWPTMDTCLGTQVDDPEYGIISADFSAYTNIGEWAFLAALYLKQNVGSTSLSTVVSQLPSSVQNMYNTGWTPPNSADVSAVRFSFYRRTMYSSQYGYYVEAIWNESTGNWEPKNNIRATWVWIGAKDWNSNNAATSGWLNTDPTVYNFSIFSQVFLYVTHDTSGFMQSGVFQNMISGMGANSNFYGLGDAVLERSGCPSLSSITSV